MRVMLLSALFAFCATAVHAAEVVFQTSKGEIRIEVDEANAPVTAENFLAYVRDGFYDGIIFHRVIPGFVVQGGGFESGMKERQTRAPIINEAGNGLKNLEYTLSMARTADPNSATSQFFINLQDNAALDYAYGNPGYAVFGKVIDGEDTVDDIADAPTGTVGPFRDVPLEEIIIEKATVVQ